jgi:thiol:disulfide interchange protein DsbC
MIKKILLITVLGSFFMSGAGWAESTDMTVEKKVDTTEETKKIEDTKKAEETKNTAEGSVNSDNAVITKIKAELKTMFGGEEADSVVESAFPGLYEVSLGTEVIYVSADTKYLFYGNLIDRENRTDLTRKAKQKAEKRFSVKRKQVMDKQDPTKTISFKAKDEKEVLAVFTDIDCPYCAKFHNEVPKLNEAGITVQYYMFPRAGVGSGSFKKAVSAWCAEDKQAALTKAKNREEIPAKECDNPIEAQYKLGQEIGVNGTPALVTSKGTLIPGYMPAAALIARLKSEKTDKK